MHILPCSAHKRHRSCDTYPRGSPGGVLGTFVLGIVNKHARGADANVAFVVAVTVNAFFFVTENYVTGELWVAWQR